MYLTRVKMRNFKSFSGTTEIPFEPGFTGIAGPNGMGKSNISDAILFVLGPTSSKALRADRLTHLLFNGGSSKKPATECEVSLVFGNQDRLLPVESDTVEITRYVKLAPSDANGYYSYFYVNGRRTTQTEIDAVLSHARLAGDGYNLVQQGDVNKVVTMGPVPRRGLVERLAGISQYNDELERADAKRQSLETNLDRIHTLLTEVQSRLGSLEAQRTQALQYKELDSQKRRAEAQLARAGHRAAEQEVATSRGLVEKLGHEVDDLQAETKKLGEERDALNDEIEALEREIAARGGAEAARFKQELDGKRMAFARLDENLRHATEEAEELGRRRAALEAQLAADEKERRGFETRERALGRTLADVEENVARETKELETTTGATDATQGPLVEARRRVLELERKRDSEQAAWQEAVAQRESAKATLEATERDLAQSEDDERSRSLELKDAELHAKESRGSEGKVPAETQQKELFTLRAREKSLTEQADHLQQEVFELNRRYLALEARLKARTESGSRPSALAAVDFLLSQRNLGKLPGVRGTVEELAGIDPAHQTALQVAGGGRFQALVVETDRVAEECIQLLRSEKRGRATFLPLNKMLAGRPKGKSLLVAQAPGAVGFAIDLVKFDEELRPAFWYVFGETVVMSDLSQARAQSGGVRLVTLAGDLIEATGAISGGYLEPGDRGRGADSSVELKRIGDELRAKSAEENHLRTEIAPLADRIRALGEELAKRSGQEEMKAAARKIVDRDVATARERLQEAGERIRRVTSERAKAEKALARADEESSRLSKELASVQDELRRLQASYLERLPSSLSKRLRTLQESLGRSNEERSRLTGELEGVRASLKALSATVEERRGELVTLGKANDEKDRERAATAKARDVAHASLEALREVEVQQGAAAKELLAKKTQLESHRAELFQRLGRAEEAVRSRTLSRNQEAVRLATAEQSLAEVEKALADLPPAAEDEPIVAVDELKRQIRTLTDELAAFGAVNLRALEEYESEKARLDEFGSEVERLTTEKKDLLGLVNEVETKKREKIGEVVVQVNRAFQRIYSDLSGGGEGEIALENPKDPLAGGLLIRARPVGKTVRALEALSGGEKSLASLAFIFALQNYDPSPLYVFDEVDMSLDGVNAENLGRMLRRNSERAQFLVISLRKVTLKSARQLLGVTMHGDGCSRVVSLKLDEIKDVDEHEHAAEPLPSPPTPSTEEAPVPKAA